MEKFLDFWNHHNATIIETLVGLILISTIYLVYRTFFGAKEAEADGAGAGVNTAHIEKTLQKILEQQTVTKTTVVDGGGAPAELMLELNDLKLALEEKEKQIVILNEKAAQAAKAASAPGAGPSQEAIAAAANAAAGLAEKERSDYEAKIKELEARLAEYEIISEDIADLSFFKEENARLTKELEELRGAGGGSAPAAPAAAAAPASSAPAEGAPPAAAAAPAAAAPVAETVSTASAEAQNAIDDSLMAEFAKAVEGQKSGSLESSPKTDENNKLLEEFENFNKKS